MIQKNTCLIYITLLALLVEHSLVHWYQQCVTVHHVPKCMSCHKAIVVITGRVHYFTITCIYIYIYIYIYVYIYIYIYIYIFIYTYIYPTLAYFLVVLYILPTYLTRIRKMYVIYLLCCKYQLVQVQED